MKWQLVAFDLDNTLFSHEHAFEHAIKRCFKIFQDKDDTNLHTVNEDVFFSLFKFNCDNYWDDYEQGNLTRSEYRRKRFCKTMTALKLLATNNQADAFHTCYDTIIDDYSVPFPGLQELLETIANQEIKLAIITNGNVNTQYNKIEKLGISHVFNCENIFISEEVGFAKPDKRFFKWVETELSVSSSKCVFVGDSWELDIVGAVDAGWEAIFFNSRGEQRTTVHRVLKEVATFPDLKSELIRLVTEGRAL
ncbi:HAD family hydrolase [Salipaludibacillus sp. LMS25]|jgi:HAD superfamily hydrolase (TIGR01549 family)|uniref:HAD family hydrolase n=1 Tax=Salipaludibacillus sp. LMS25 TaxID=2924031 RepID=UPI0020D0743B|nr:HAD family hydrolase [Salipaludibacillus sp. LMS25]UTR14434.1 HAD family hydrolase [Salipaludibacillus sp. LMS25]